MLERKVCQYELLKLGQYVVLLLPIMASLFPSHVFASPSSLTHFVAGSLEWAPKKHALVANDSSFTS